MRDQLDRVKREIRYFDEPLSDEEGGSLDPPTIKKGGDDAARPGPSAVSPTRVRRERGRERERKREREREGERGRERMCFPRMRRRMRKMKRVLDRRRC